MRRWSRLLRGGVDRNQTEVVLAWQEQTSPPARRRGSKPMPLHRQHRPNGRLLRGGVDRNSCVRGWAVTRVSRLLRGGVDRNVGATLAAFIVARSPPARRRGSKPDRDCGVTTRQDVASCAEAWIETLSRIATAAVAMVAYCAEIGRAHV